MKTQEVQPRLPIDWALTMIIPWVRDCLFDSDTVGQLAFCDFLQVPLCTLVYAKQAYRDRTISASHRCTVSCFEDMQPWTRMPCCSCWLHASARQRAHPRTAAGGYKAGWNNLKYYVKTCRTYPLLQFREWKGEAFFGFVFPMFYFQVTKPGPLWDLEQIAATIDGPATFRAPWAWSLAWKK